MGELPGGVSRVQGFIRRADKAERRQLTFAQERKCDQIKKRVNLGT